MDTNAIEAIKNIDLNEVNRDPDNISAYLLGIAMALKQKIGGPDEQITLRASDDKEKAHEIYINKARILAVICIENKYPVKFISYDSGVNMGVRKESDLDELISSMVQELEFVDFVNKHRTSIR